MISEFAICVQRFLRESRVTPSPGEADRSWRRQVMTASNAVTLLRSRANAAGNSIVAFKAFWMLLVSYGGGARTP